MIMKELNLTPAKGDFYMPGEYYPHYGTLMIWPERPGSWGKDRKKIIEAFVEIITTIAETEKLYLFATGRGVTEAKKHLSAKDGKLNQNIIIHEYAADDSWARDTGPTFLLSRSGEELLGLDWQFNAWGGKYDGLYGSWDKDQEVAKELCGLLNAECKNLRDFVLEGGSIHSDGEGTIITTEECLLSPGRNPQMTKDEIEIRLKETLGAEKVIWLPYGIYNDETNGHVDNICCFASPGHVLLAWCEDESDPQWERSTKALSILLNERDAKGRKIKVTKLPVPSKTVTVTLSDLGNLVFEEGEDEREAGERLAASYVNFYILNGKVLLPQFGDTKDSVALEILKEVFPDRQIVPVFARDILLGGGNIHCITQQIPKTL